VYSIGEFSRLSQIPVKTLRYYDDLRLMRPACVNRSTGYRYYEAAQLEQLNRILVFKVLGFSLREIRGLLAEHVPAERIRGVLRRKREEVARRVIEERARLARVAARLDAIERCHRPIAYEVAVRRVGARLVASRRDGLSSYDECERLFAELRDASATTSLASSVPWSGTTAQGPAGSTARRSSSSPNRSLRSRACVSTRCRHTPRRASSIAARTPKGWPSRLWASGWPWAA